MAMYNKKNITKHFESFLSEGLDKDMNSRHQGSRYLKDVGNSSKIGSAVRFNTIFNQSPLLNSVKLP